MSEIIASEKINAFFQLNSHLDHPFEHHAERHCWRSMNSTQEIINRGKMPWLLLDHMPNKDTQFG